MQHMNAMMQFCMLEIVMMRLVSRGEPYTENTVELLHGGVPTGNIYLRWVS